MRPRYTGILLHPTSLQSDYGIGTFGPEAYEFVDIIEEKQFKLWQILPLGPTGYGNSPYSARSAFAGNTLLISLNLLNREGLITDEELASAPPFPEKRVDYQRVESWKIPLLKKAAARFLKNPPKDYFSFCESQRYWLDDWALYMPLYEKYNDSRWDSLWDEKYKTRDPEALKKLKEEYPEKIERVKALQYIFSVQWSDLKEYANRKGIQIVGDIPVFVGGDSCDAWSHIDLLQTDDEGHYDKVSGVPPDYFCADGQRWGTPLYDWDHKEEECFQWWFHRFAHLDKMCDIVRIDHFRGFESYWAIDSSCPTARDGEWVKAPGLELFRQIAKRFPEMKIIAEDLGFTTDEVIRLRDTLGFPGMILSQHGFESCDPTHESLSHHWQYNKSIYTGTHDNETSRGWYQNQSPKVQQFTKEYLECTDKTVVREMVKSVIAGVEKYAIIPIQDLLDLDNTARMNTPGTTGDQNWSFRLHNHDLNKELEWIKPIIKKYDR